MSNEYDYIIIGAGAAGATLAYKLTKPSKKGKCLSVLLLEQGGNYVNDPLVTDPRNAFVVDNDPRTTVQYPTLRDPGLNGQIVYFSQGQSDGGSTSHNYMFTGYVSNNWLSAFEQTTGISAAKYREAQQDLETFVPQTGTTPDASRGTKGPLTISQTPVGSTLPAFPTTAQTAGINDQVTTAGFAYQLGVAFGAPERIPPADDFNSSIAGLQAGVYVREQYSIKQDGTNWLRSTPGTEFLNRRQIKKVDCGLYQSKCKGNLVVVNYAHVTQILFDEECHGKKKRQRANGVCFFVGTVCTNAYAKCGVILSGGVIDSPRLLQLSGIGDKATLCAAGIKARVNLPAVGLNLRFHTDWSLNLGSFNQAYAEFPAILGLVDDPTTNLTPPYPVGYVPQRTVQFFVLPPSPGVVPYVVNIQAWNLVVRSSGTVTVVENNPLTFPRIEFNPVSNADDAALFVDAATRIAAAVTAVNVVNPGTLFYLGFDPTGASAAAIIANVAATATFAHGVGTCTMGADKTTSVVDRKFRVHCVKGLYVCDNSVVPFAADINTAPTAETLAWILGEQLRGR